jgi:DNA-binding MarR family transcriptional regulator
MERHAEPEVVDWLTEDQLHEWKSLVGLLMSLPPALDTQLKRDAGVNTFEYHVLAALSAAPGGHLPMSQLAGSSRGSMSRLSHAVSRLEEAGWVERRACTGEGHRTEAKLTEAGWEKIRRCAPGHVREARRLVIDVLTPEQLQALGTAARAVIAVADPAMAAALDRELADQG